jgi:hypothetical protein
MLRYKVLVAILTVGLVISLGINGYLYTLVTSRQGTINNLINAAIGAWAKEMGDAGYQLQNATTNAKVLSVTDQFNTADLTILMAWDVTGQTVYAYMDTATGRIYNALQLYIGDYPPLKYINQTAVKMFAVLYAKIQNLTYPIQSIMEFQYPYPTGKDPMLLLKENGLINSTINNCKDIINYTDKIENFSPKFI